eukprot:GHVU01108609.1.p1 GENE.GHVU01108609.1~~GHVU01108609.1.p1  ORF type:complete len:510 (-),score=28.43 GHVU01108609.1:241-1677(-)
MCNTAAATKYMCKYMMKGPDYSRVGFVPHNAPDEIAHYRWHRHYTACEAFWRLNGYHVTELSPAVVRLDIHLPRQQYVTYPDPATEHTMTPQQWQREGHRVATTMLLGWFNYNSEALSSDTSLTRSDLPSYLEMPERFTWHALNHKWIPRVTRLRFPTIGRLRHVHPSAGELFYLRLLLLHDNHSKGATSFTDLLTVNGVVRIDFRTVCQLIGIVYDHSYLSALLSEVETYNMPSQMRVFFSILMDNHNPPHIADLFTRFCASMTEDWSTRDRPLQMTTRCTLLWLDLQSKFNQRGRDIMSYGLAHLAPSTQETLRLTQLYPEFSRFAPTHIPRVIAQELSYDSQALANDVSDLRLQLTDEQADIYNHVLSLRTRYTVTHSLHSRFPHLRDASAYSPPQELGRPLCSTSSSILSERTATLPWLSRLQVSPPLSFMAAAPSTHASSAQSTSLLTYDSTSPRTLTLLSSFEEHYSLCGMK